MLVCAGGEAANSRSRWTLICRQITRNYFTDRDPVGMVDGSTAAAGRVAGWKTSAMTEHGLHRDAVATASGKGSDERTLSTDVRVRPTSERGRGRVCARGVRRRAPYPLD